MLSADLGPRGRTTNDVIPTRLLHGRRHTDYDCESSIKIDGIRLMSF